MSIKSLLIDEIGLSTRSANGLRKAGVFTVGDMMKQTRETLWQMRSMGAKSVEEVAEKIAEYKKKDVAESLAVKTEEIRDSICKTVVEEQKNELQWKKSLHQIPISDILSIEEYHETILMYVKMNDLEIQNMEISSRCKTALITHGRYCYLSDIIFMSRRELEEIRNMGPDSVNQIIDKINEYLEKNESRLRAVISGNKDSLWSDDRIKKAILDEYKEAEFKGLSLEEIGENLNLPEQVTIGKLKSVIDQIIEDKKLKEMDHLYFYNYKSFKDFLESEADIKERKRQVTIMRLLGKTLEEIGKSYDLSRERVRQIAKEIPEKVRKQYIDKTGLTLFDEDRYRYFYKTYEFERKDTDEWFEIPCYVWNYLDFSGVEQGKRKIQDAVKDASLSKELRIKIDRYLRRDHVCIDGVWIKKERTALERVAVRELCVEDTSFDTFFYMYNQFLEQKGVPYDENLYFTESNKKYIEEQEIAKASYLLKKQNAQIRYYDINAQDYTELMDTLNLGSYKNTGFSTEKFMRAYPEVMKKYDIRDKYELHNLLRKIVCEGSYHREYPDFICKKMPTILFGEFDRDAAIRNIIIENSPVRAADLAERISQEYGYTPELVMSEYLKPFSAYCHRGVYSLEQKGMDAKNKAVLQNALTDDFYYIDEIKSIYKDLFPDADVEEVNAYNLKSMGFIVLSKCVIQHYTSLEKFFEHLFTRGNFVDITEDRKKYGYIAAFNNKLAELKRDHQIFEYEPNKIITFGRLEECGVTKEMLREYCDKVYEFTEDEEYFSIQSLRKNGFTSELYDLELPDLFFANILFADDRFSFGKMMGTVIFFKGEKKVTKKTFIMDLICAHKCINICTLIGELEETFGIRNVDKAKILLLVEDTKVYYADLYEVLCADRETYEKEYFLNIF